MIAVYCNAAYFNMVIRPVKHNVPPELLTYSFSIYEINISYLLVILVALIMTY